MIGQVHLGVGRFHRAHQAVYTQKVHDDRWGIVGACLRSRDTKLELEKNGNVYTVVSHGASGTEFEKIDCLKKVLFAPEQKDELLTYLASDEVKIVTLTITEKGYCHFPQNRKLDFENESIKADLAGNTTSALGYIVEALKTRQTPLTILSCDNMPENGETLKGLILELVDAMSPDRRAWIEENVRFPSSMVDRIVPAISNEELKEAEKQLGYSDPALILTEKFSQWVIEDNFAAERPRWEDAGAQLVSDVRPYEEMKLRLLNGSHSTLAYLGSLSGFETVDQAVNWPPMEKFLREMMKNELAPTLSIDTDLESYQDQLIERFKNPNLKHRLLQIAMDGSQKLPQRLLAPMGDSSNFIFLAVAGWICANTRFACSDEYPEISDPLKDQLLGLKGSASEVLDQILTQTDIFPKITNLQKNKITEMMTLIKSTGPKAAIEKLLGEKNA